MTGRRLRAPLLLAVVWLLGALVATSIGVVAVRQVASEVGDPAVPELPVQAPVTSGRPPAAAPSASPVTPDLPRAQTFRSTGGTVAVECMGTAARLLYAAPSDGWRLDERSSAGQELEVRFESDEARVRLGVSCASGAPRLVEQRADDRRSGGDD